MSDDKSFLETLQKSIKEKDLKLETAKKLAASNGKEILTKENLAKYYSPLYGGEITDAKLRDAEDLYYLTYPKLKTVKELAPILMQSDSY